MKRTRLLISLLVMLVAASGYAQDSYRQAVRDYLATSEDMEQGKTLITTLSTIFDKSGEVDIDQLTNRYIEERLEEDVVEFLVDHMTTRGLTEADIKEMAALLNSPQGTAYRTHILDFARQFFINYSAPIQKLYTKNIESEEMVDFATLLESEPILPNPDIDDTYLAKYNAVMMDSLNGPAKKAIDRIYEETAKNSTEAFNDLNLEGINEWITKNAPTIMLNSSYETMTLEDLDYVANLFANEAYLKFIDQKESIDTNKHYLTKYKDWMNENGAKVSEEPGVAVGLYREVFKSMNLDFDEYFPMFKNN